MRNRNTIKAFACAIAVIAVFCVAVSAQKVPSPSPQRIVFGSPSKTFTPGEYEFVFFAGQKDKPRVRVAAAEGVQAHSAMADEYVQRGRLRRSAASAQRMRVSVFLAKIDAPRDFNTLSKSDERYRISVADNGDVEFHCEGYVSFLRALETFAQLFDGKSATLTHLPIEIEDEPSYAHRGIMIDTSRTWLPVETILRTIQGMQVAKLSVLHWHISDSESFPLQLLGKPQITAYGAYSDNQIYYPEDVQKIVQEGQARGVIIIPELDTPAHTRAWALSDDLQQINACYGYPPKDWEKYCGEPPCGQFDVTLDLTYEVVQSAFNDAQRYFPSTYFHIGGDEVNVECWNYRPAIQQWMTANNISNYDELQNYYFTKISAFVDSQKQKIFWFNNQQKGLSYPPNSIIQYWGSEASYADLTSFTEPVILSTFDYLYFDCGTGNQLGGNSWCDPYKMWLKVYSFDPSKANLGDRLLGAEAPLWSEMINNSNFEYKTWPRATALALRLWNVAENLNLPQLAQKLVDINNNLKDIGIEPGPISDEYCERNVNMCFFVTK